MRGCLSFGASLLLLLGACPGGAKQGPPVTCVDGDTECGAACSEAEPCEAGLYCTGAGLCAKQCIASREGMCPGAAQCAENGKCMEPSSSGAGTGGAGGHGGSGAGASGAGGASAGKGGSGSGGACAETVVTTRRVQPTVILIVDQSSSMSQNMFPANGSQSRWDVLKQSLLAEDGLIKDLQSQVRFGLALYSADSNGDANGTTADVCPEITPVVAALDNFSAINDVYLTAPTIEDTPTGDSIDAVLDSLDLQTNPSTDDHPIVFVLATDGEPDRCENLDPVGITEEDLARAESVDAVARAFTKNIRTYVISVGDEVSQGHLQDVADAGLGHGPSDEPAQYWVAGNDDTLSDALREIVGSEVSCDIELSGSVQGSNPCLGSVELNGVALTCNDANGWQLTDPSHVRLVGTACEQLKTDQSATLDVSFPCEVQIVFPD
jgi:hypothetical protein